MKVPPLHAVLPLAVALLAGLVRPTAGAPPAAHPAAMPVVSATVGLTPARAAAAERISVSASTQAPAKPAVSSQPALVLRLPKQSEPKQSTPKQLLPEQPLQKGTAAQRSAPATPESGIVMIRGVPYYGQVETEDCETAALQMALAHEGIRVSQRKLLETEGVSLLPPVVDARGAVIRWGDPYTSFVGHPNSADIGTRYTASSGYGTYASNIARVARRFGGKVLWFGTGLTRQHLTKAIEQGHPVIVWVGDRDGKMLSAPLSYWTATDGRRVPYPATSSGVYEHTVLVAGVTPAGPYVDDPLNGARSGANINPVVGPGVVSWSSFLAGLATFHGMAVIME